NNDHDTTICLTGHAFPAPQICPVNPVSLTVPACGATDSTTMDLCNSGGSDLTYNISGVPTWASLPNTSGTIIPSGSVTITVTMNSETYSAGPQTTNLTITSNAPLQPTLINQITMTVGNNPCINIGGSIDPCTGIGTFTTS